MCFVLCIQNEHSSLVSKYETYKKEMSANSKQQNKRKVGDDDDSKSKIPTKQSKLSVTSNHSQSQPSQSKLDSLIVDYIVESMSPLSTVEKRGFVALVEGLVPGAKVMTRKTLSDRINAKFDKVMSQLHDELNAADVVCTTADIWSVNNKSFMGMTVHWLLPNLKRNSAALTCCRFFGSHTYDRIAEVICDVHNCHDLEFGKIVTTVTDNASNFAKAFSEYMVIEDEQELRGEELNEGHDSEAVQVNLANDNSSVPRQEQQTEIVVHEVGDILANADVSSIQLQLPLHTRCVCHSLNLIATKDAEEAFKTPAYSKMHHACMGKCQALWNAVNRSSKAADKVAEICVNKKLLIPGQTRWNARYDAICRILELKDKLSLIADALQLPKFARNELDFLVEYKNVMEPLAVTLDQLQGDKDCYYGLLLPKLTQLRHKLQKMQAGGGSMLLCSALVTSLLSGLVKRFEKFFDLNVTDTNVKEAVLAAVSHPGYKLKWVEPTSREHITQQFVSAATRLAEKASEQADGPGTPAVSDDDYGYGEAAAAAASPANNSIQMQVRYRMFNYTNFLFFFKLLFKFIW